MNMYIGIDIGGTNVRIASTESLTNPKIQHKVAFHSESAYEDNMRRLKEAIDSFGGVVESVGVGAPGKLNDTRTFIVFTRYASQWVDKPLAEDLARMFGCTVVLDGDSPVGALGEAMYGGHHSQDFYYIAYGTGIGSARIIFDNNGKPHVRKVTDEEHRVYLNPWQQECGGRGVESTVGKPAAQLSEAEWQTVMGKFKVYLLRYIEYFQPATIVFGGGVAVKQWLRIESAANALLAEHPEITANIVLTSLGEDTALYGAFGLLRELQKTKK